MNRSRHSCCLSNIVNIKSLCFVRSWQYGWSSNKSFLVWLYWVTPALVIQSQGVFVLTSWHQPPLTNKKALLSWHHKMTSPLSNQEAHLWWRHSPPIKRTSHTIWYFSSHLGSEKTVMAFQCSLQWSEREGTSSTPREKMSGASPRRNCRWTGRRVSTHDKHCLRICRRNACGCTSSPWRWTRSEREGTHRRHERKCPERQRDGEPAAVSLLTINTAFEHIEDIQYACDASKLNTRHRTLAITGSPSTGQGHSHQWSRGRLCSSLTACRTDF